MLLETENPWAWSPLLELSIRINRIERSMWFDLISTHSRARPIISILFLFVMFVQYLPSCPPRNQPEPQSLHIQLTTQLIKCILHSYIDSFIIRPGKYTALIIIDLLWYFIPKQEEDLSRFKKSYHRTFTTFLLMLVYCGSKMWFYGAQTIGLNLK